MPTPACSIELLEDRIAPASVNAAGNIITYQDSDGDHVTITLSKTHLVNATNLNTIFNFDTTVAGAKQQLQTIDLTVLGQTAEGLGLTLTAKRDATAGGDGSANVGYLKASGIDLGAVKIVGDLGRIDAGSNSTKTPAIKSLDVLSMGLYGTSTQGSGASLSSNVHGGIPALTIHGDAVGIVFTVTDAAATVTDIGTLKIGGSLEGIAVAGSGVISVPHKLSSVTIGGDLLGSANDNTGQIVSGGSIGPVKIGGSIRGGDGQDSGAILANGAAGTIKSITIGDNLAGGGGTLSGEIYATITVGLTTIKDSVLGGTGQQSASINAGTATVPGQIVEVDIFGDLIGGTGEGSAEIGDPVAVSNNASQVIVSAVSVGGSIIGNAFGSGSISGGLIGQAIVIGSVIGGPVGATFGDNGFSGLIFSPNEIDNVQIDGSLIGHDDNTGEVLAGRLGTMFLGHDLIGGDGGASGSINASSLASLAVHGSVRSGTGSFAGSLTVSGVAGAVSVAGSIIGTAADPVEFSILGNAGDAKTLSLKSLTIGGSATSFLLLGGYSGDGNGVENADAHIGAVKVGRDWIASSLSAGVVAGTGGFGANNDSLGTVGLATAPTPNLSSIASITIGGQILGTVGGSDHYGFAAQSIGAIKIDGVLYPKLTDTARSLALGSTGDVTAHLV